MSAHRIHWIRSSSFFAFAATAILSACSGVHDTPVDAIHRAAVPDTDPLPVPADTIVPPDLTANGKLAVGNIPGHSEITDDGAAHYTIPLWVPPGRAGMQPDLALEYQSRGPNGLLGVGWSLTGFSQITRCPHSFATEGHGGPVKFDATDALCLDGQRLKNISTDPKRPAYKTEHDSFVAVLADLASDTFAVYERGGRIRRYTGYKLNRAVSAAWALTRIEDRYGNTIDFTYTDNTPRCPGCVYTPYIYPDTITYTGSTATGAAPGNRKIVFGYEARTDGEYSAASGQVNLSKRINRIEMRGPDVNLTSSLLRSYDFVYATGSDVSITQRSLLKTITTSDGTGHSLQATSFQWQLGTPGFTRLDSLVNDYLFGNYQGGYRLIDLNGDGFADLFYVVKAANGDSSYAVRFWEPGHSDFGPRHDWQTKPQTSYDGVYTFPQPALSDASTALGLLMWQLLPNAPPNQPSPIMRQVQPLPDGNIEFGTYFTFPSAVNVVFPADFDGDGLADVITGTTQPNANATFSVSRNLGTHPATFASGVNIPLPWVAKGMAELGAIAPFRGVDLDGDGRQELTVCFPNAPNGAPSYAVVTIDNGYPQPTNWPGCAMRPVFLDFNGDGLDDALSLGVKFYDGITMTINPGPTSLSDPHLYGLPYPITGGQNLGDSRTEVRILDYNLDGRPDILFVNGDRSTIIRNYRNGDLVDSGASVPAGDLTTLPEVGDLNGDGLDDIITYENGRFAIYLRKGDRPDMLTRVTDGYGGDTKFVYRPISDPVIYTPRPVTSAVYPIRPINGGLWVATQRTVSTSAGTTQTDFHKYEGAVEDIQRGFLGFAAHENRWVKSGGAVTQRQEFDNSRQRNVDPFVGFPIRDTTTITDATGHIVHKSVRNQSPVMEYDSDFGTYWVHPGTVTTTNFDPDASGALVQTYLDTVSVVSVDRVGHIVSATEVEGAGTSRTYDATYQYSMADWLVEMPTQLVLTSTGKRPCPTCRAIRQIRTIAYKYDAHGGLEWEIVEPSLDANGQIVPLPQPQPDGVQSLFTHYVRESDGQIATVTQDVDFTATAKQRVETFYRDGADRVFVTRMKNKLGHMVHSANHPGLGVLAALQDQNGQYSRFQYDTFGRPKRNEPANAEPSSFTYLPYTINGFDATKLELHHKGDGGSELITQFDGLGNVAHRRSIDRNDGRGVLVDFSYDEANQLIATTRPRFDGAAASASDRWKYDAAGRLVRRDLADGRVDQYAYLGASDGLHIDHWDADPSDATALKSTAIFNLAGLPSANIQHAAAKDGRPARDLTVAYSYGAFDLTSGITSLNGTLLAFGYDRLGRGIFVNDPSSESRSYGFDAFNDLASETLGAEVRLRTYDDLGRAQTLQTRDGTTTWRWDTAANGLGKLASTASPTGVGTTLVYDSKSRLVDQIETIGASSFDVTIEPDAFGRTQRLLYPTVNGSRYAVRYSYGAHGALAGIVNDATGLALWNAVETDAAGNPTNPSGAFPQYTLGGKITVRYLENGTRAGVLQRISAATTTTLQSLTYGFDSKGNLQQRSDDQRGLNETFDYDELNRLEHWAVTSKAGPSRVRFDYDDLGNLTGRTYEAGSGTNTTFGYTGERGAGPYAVTTANSLLFGYDGEGNQAQAGTRTAVFSSFGLPLSISQNQSVFEFHYDANGTRAEKKVTTGGQVEDTIVVGGVYRKHSLGGVDDHGFVVAGPTGPLAYVTIAGNGTTATSFIVPDHLGSADTIVNGTTLAVIETRKFDPFGNRFDPLNPTGAAPALASPVPFGFTGHEHDWELGLINMRGRMFDPASGRFLSPDPFVQSPATTVGLNNYAYALDNPGTNTDHSGFYVDTGADPGAGDGGGIFSGAGGTGITIGFGDKGSGSSRHGGSHGVMAAANLHYNAVDPTAVRTTVAGRSYSPDRVFAERSGKLARFSDWVVDHPYKGFAVIFGGVFTAGMTGGVIYGVATGTLVVGTGAAATGGAMVPLAPKVAQVIDEEAPALEAEAQTLGSVLTKLETYLLDPNHPVGGDKAAWFEKALGFTRQNLMDLARQINFNSNSAVPTELTKFGQKYEQVINIVGANGRAIDVLFVWIRNNDGIVRLVTGIPTKR